MFPAPEPPLNTNELSRSIRLNDPIPTARQPHSGNSKAVASFVHSADHALWLDAAFRAADFDNIDGRLPLAPQPVEIPITQTAPTPQSATAADQWSLGEDLLANDSLGG